MEASQSIGPERHGDEAESRNEVDEPVIDIDEEKVDDDKKTSGSRRSFVWEHFTYVKDATEVKCPYCNKKMAANTKKNGTSALANHLYNVCKTSPIYKKIDSKKQSILSFKASKSESGGSSLATHSFSQEKCRKSLACMCIMDNRPFSVVDDEGFRQYSLDLNPLFKIPSRWTVARDCLMIYKEEAKKLKNVLKNQTVSLTTDTWTSVQNFNYMCLTAHWIDDDWVLRKKILNFCPITNHKGETIGKLVYKCL